MFCFLLSSSSVLLGGTVLTPEYCEDICHDFIKLRILSYRLHKAQLADAPADTSQGTQPQLEEGAQQSQCDGFVKGDRVHTKSKYEKDMYDNKTGTFIRYVGLDCESQRME